MQKFYKRIIFIFSLLCFYSSSQATHIVGGEFYYKWLGGNVYAIELRVYRDCYNGVPFFDNPASIGIFDINNTLLQERCVFYIDYDTIPPTIVAPCFIPPTDVCYERAVYRDTLVLPPIAGGYQLSYQRCCRNQTILNIQNPLGVGITIYASTPSDTANADNSNPVFDSLPPPFICLGLPFVWDNSATDANGDSLVYELCLPFIGGIDINNCPGGVPICGTGTPTWTCGPQPMPPADPPYSNVTWQPPFSLANLLGGTPMAINPATGILTATPNTVGQFVYGVCVNEYRNNVLIGKTRRDFQVNVVPCPSLIVAAIQNPLIFCSDSTAFFQNLSIGASSYDWDFGDPTTLADTSHVTNPSYQYPDTGTYIVTLIAHSSFNPNCADTVIDTLHVYPAFDVDFSFTDSLCTYFINFTDTVTDDGGGTTSIWNWTFGGGGTSNSSDPSHSFPGPGNYNVTFIATSDRGCKDTVSHVVTVDSLPSVTVSVQAVNCNGDCNATATANPKGGNSPYSYLWSNGQTTQVATSLCAGTYTVTLTDSDSCTAIKTVNINQPAVLASTLSSTDAYCEGKCIGTATANPSGGTPGYTYSWNDPSNQQTQTASNLCPGNYAVVITDNHGCTRIDTVTVNYSDYIPPLDATVSEDTIYQGQTVQLTSTVYSNTTYTWTPPDFLTNPSISNPSATLTALGVYVYVVEITDSFGCKNTDSVRIVMRRVSCVEPEIFIPNAFTPNTDGNNDVLYVRGSMIRELLFRVYDRWGEKVFETNIPGTGWNGTYKGKPVQPGVYDYYLEAICFTNEKFFKKGNVTVIK
ncbi:MAG TPA: PKD domain-containing protein [Bacteroidia bacterium]|nr:PKD domain-containing protein [Bacteroidia bacterium]